jgi:hypothetical protein
MDSDEKQQKSVCAIERVEVGYAETPGTTAAGATYARKAGGMAS